MAIGGGVVLTINDVFYGPPCECPRCQWQRAVVKDFRARIRHAQEELVQRILAESEGEEADMNGAQRARLL